MKFTFDLAEIFLSDITINTIKTFMLLFLRDMRDDPKMDKECWTWGIVTINDFSLSPCFEFEYGGDEDIPTTILENQIYVHI